jgi:hypothetical protein
MAAKPALKLKAILFNQQPMKQKMKSQRQLSKERRKSENETQVIGKAAWRNESQPLSVAATRRKQ